MGGSAFIGRVVSNRMQKSVVVAVNYVVWVPKYKVYEKRVSRHMAHDEKQECVVGDLVKIKVCRKLSKHKNYRVADILRKTPMLTDAAAAATEGGAGIGGGPASAVDASEQRLASAQERLAAVRRMYERELGPLLTQGTGQAQAGGGAPGPA